MSHSPKSLQSAMAVLAVVTALLIPAHGATAQTTGIEPLHRHDPCPTGGTTNALDGWDYCDLYLTGVDQTDPIYILGTDEDGTTGQQVCAPTTGTSIRSCGPVTMVWSFVSAFGGYTWEIWIHQGVATINGWQELSVGTNSQTPLWTGCLDEDCAGVSFWDRVDAEVGEPPEYDEATQQYVIDPPLPQTNLPSDATHGPYNSLSECLAGPAWGCFEQSQVNIDEYGGTGTAGKFYGWADPD